MINKDVELVVLAGSAGSFKVIIDLVKNLPITFAYPVLIVIHRNYSTKYNIDEVLTTRSNIAIREISDKEEIVSGMAYLAPPNYHVLIEKNKVFSLDLSEKVLFSRPSIDVSLESALAVYKSKILAILFSGASSDGAEGLLKIKLAGGFTIVQDPKEAAFNTMPNAAININAHLDILNITQIKEALMQLNNE